MTLEYLPRCPGVSEPGVACLAAINRSKTDAGVSTGRRIEHLNAAVNPATAALLRAVVSDVTAAARAKSYEVEEAEELEGGVSRVPEARFTPDS